MMFSTSMAFSQAKKPTIMVVPSDVWCNTNGYMMEFDNQGKKVKVADFNAPFPVREVSLIYNRPYAKLRLINALGQEVKQSVLPILQTSKLKNKEMIIAKM